MRFLNTPAFAKVKWMRDWALTFKAGQAAFANINLATVRERAKKEFDYTFDKTINDGGHDGVWSAAAERWASSEILWVSFPRRTWTPARLSVATSRNV